MSKEVELGKILNGVTISGDISATSFSGDGSNLTNLPTSLTSLGIDNHDTVTVDASGNVTATSFAGDGSNLTGISTLEAISASITATAVDVFVYDTSKDSDGGSWRKRCQHTSWYNETLNTATRGSRREFPAVAVIVAESNKVTIYDGDDPALPMWMVFDRPGTSLGILADGTGQTHTAITAIKAVNGKLFSAKGMTPANNAWGGITSWDLISEIATKATTRSTGYVGTAHIPFSERNSITVTGLTFSTPNPQLVNDVVNDVAMTVLPDAPIDPATGLPVPTIAVATDGGVSVIKDDGTVVDITYSSYSISGFVAFSKANSLMFTLGNSITPQNFLHIYHTIPSVDVNNADAGFRAGASDEYYSVETGFTSLYTGLDARIPFSGISNADITDFVDGAVGNLRGLAYVSRVPSTPTATSFAAITSTYNTGWMNGDIKGAFLADTDDTDLVGSGELVTNGTFDTDTSGWTFEGTATDSSAAGYLEGTTGGATNNLVYTTIATEIGKTYIASVDNVGVSGSLAILAGGSGFSSTRGISGYVSSDKNASLIFTATATTTYISIRASDANKTVRIDNISVKLADADRSVNNNGLIVNGTVTRSAVTTGAELVAYSGFTNNNYLEQPYNPALDFGTGDFCVMGWVNVDVDTWGIIVDRYTGSSGRFSLGYTPSGSSAVAEFYINGYRRQGTTLLGSTWRHVTLVRSGGVASLYVDGVLDASFSRPEDVTSNTSAPLIIGKRYDNVQQADQLASFALLRISATAPTADQILKIYNDEKVLFQENAACTLYGASDAVTALAHDPDTNLLHVGTSAGRSVFQGLRRVDNTTTAVGTAISASGALVVEE